MHTKEEITEKDNAKAQQLVDEEGAVLLDITPMKKTCRHCENDVVTYVEHELSPIFYIFLLFSMFIFGWTFIFLIPFAYLLLQNAVHRCSMCLNEIGTRHNFGIPDFTQDFLTLKLGKSMIIVVSRKVGIAAFVVLSLIFLYFSWIYDFGSIEIDSEVLKSYEIKAEWTEFIEE